MKIVHTESSSGWGGQELRILSEAQGMRARGHDVTLIAPRTHRIYAEALARGLPAADLPIGRKNVRGIMKLRGWLATHPVDVVNSHSSTDSWLVAIACKALGRSPALVRTRHISAAVQRDPLTRWLYSQAAKRVVTTGTALRTQLIAQNGFPAERIVSVPTGIDVAQFSPGDKREARSKLGLAPDARYVGIVATLRSWKGHLVLLDALQRLDDCSLLVIGDGPRRALIEARVRELGLEARVRLVGHQEDPAPWLRALDVFCLPSYANEGVPQALMQAMLVGVPVVTTSIGGIPEIVNAGHTGLIVPPNDPAALADAIAWLLADPVLAAELAQAARTFGAQRFSKDLMLDRMERVFRDATAPA